jgi:hypothetical protein
VQEEPDVHSRHLSIAQSRSYAQCRVESVPSQCRVSAESVPCRAEPSRVSAEPSRAVPSQCRAEPCEDYFAHQVRWQE